MIKTTLKMEGKRITHTGTSGMTVTGTRQGDDLTTLVEISDASPEELGEMVVALLAELHKDRGEDFVMAILNRYGQEVDKMVFIANIRLIGKQQGLSC